MRRLASTCALGAALWLAGWCTPSGAHELESHRLTVVQRDARHLSFTLYVDLPVVLHRAMAPRSSFQEFVLAHAAMKPADLAAALRSGQARLDAGTRLSLPDGAVTNGLPWQWPDAGQVQKLLQERTMQWLTGATEHRHSEPTALHAEWRPGADVKRVAIKLPPELGDVLVVHYRPSQAWARPQAPALNLRF